MIFLDEKNIVKSDKELKPCPFCGQIPVVVATTDYHFEVVCKNCGAKLPSKSSTCLDGYDKTLSDVTAKWNVRSKA